MNRSIEERMQYVEDQLKQIRKELEESLGRYKDSKYPVDNKDTDWWKGFIKVCEKL